MTKHLVTAITTLFVLLFSFQNCQKTAFQDEVNSQSIVSDKVDLKDESVESINFLIEDVQNVVQSGHTYQVKYFKKLQVDLQSGIILETSDINQETDQYCLTANLKDELFNILNSSQVCTTQPELPPDTMCTQVMKMQYAELITSKQQFNLGSASNGCGSNAIDLCGDSAALLKNFSESLKKEYKNLACQ